MLLNYTAFQLVICNHTLTILCILLRGLIKPWMFLNATNRFREKVGVKVVKALKRNNDGVTHAAIDMLCALMQV